MKIAFVGGGNMAQAMIGGLLAKGHARDSMRVVEPSAETRARLTSAFGVDSRAACDAATVDADVLVLAVKPQKMREATTDLRAHLGDRLVLSIAAGIRLADLSRWLGGHGKLVRGMPNTPALIGQGIAGLYAPPSVGGEDRRRAEEVLGAVGETLWVADESMIDAITAVSGSGPAYVFYFMEAMQQGAQRLGFSADDARKLALATFRGAALLAASAADPVSVLRERVTSKGGTTEAALAAMELGGVRDAILAALDAANRRGRELGEQLGKD
jgi:pyrroline-5-carboxylate reductase